MNVSVLVVGSGRSMFKNTLLMPCKPQNFKQNEVKEKVQQVIKDNETIQQMRKFILMMTYHFRKTTDAFKIASEVAEHA